jgi:hypothetical protein
VSCRLQDVVGAEHLGVEEIRERRLVRHPAQMEQSSHVGSHSTGKKRATRHARE